MGLRIFDLHLTLSAGSLLRASNPELLRNQRGMTGSLLKTGNGSNASNHPGKRKGKKKEDLAQSGLIPLGFRKSAGVSKHDAPRRVALKAAGLTRRAWASKLPSGSARDQRSAGRVVFLCGYLGSGSSKRKTKRRTTCFLGGSV